MIGFVFTRPAAISFGSGGSLSNHQVFLVTLLAASLVTLVIYSSLSIFTGEQCLVSPGEFDCLDWADEFSFN